MYFNINLHTIPPPTMECMFLENSAIFPLKNNFCDRVNV